MHCVSTDLNNCTFAINLFKTNEHQKITDQRAFCETRLTPSADTTLLRHIEECSSILSSTFYTRGPSLLPVKSNETLTSDLFLRVCYEELIAEMTDLHFKALLPRLYAWSVPVNDRNDISI